MYTVVCGGEELDCSRLVDFIRSKNGECEKDELLNSNELKQVAKQYSDAIKNTCDIPWQNYEWFADVVIGALALSGKVRVKYDFTKVC